MLIINYPEPEFRLKKEGSKEFIFDKLRKQWLQLTPEEWVRQNFIQYLVKEKKYPASLIAVEKEIRVGELKKRFDILVYNTDHRPWMMIECKAGEIKLDESVLQQALRYNMSVPVQYIVITNGNLSFGWEKKNNALSDINELPEPP
jgi:hypothetical protein